ncbi:MAG: hypothetical protein Q4B10_00915 [Actinomycetaceae bacterium]|nr:hypothetical protein [Actinomycetaceae bacterium]
MRWPKKRERLPEVVAQALGAPTRHARAVATLEGGWFAVDRGGYVLVQAGGCVSVRGAWASLAGLVWDEGLGCVTVTFVDPARPPLTIEVAEAPSLELLTAAREGIEESHVLTLCRVLECGTTVRAWVLRDSDGQLFSLLGADGPIPPAEREQALSLEAKAREAAGLDPREAH